jgi:hypothetical protein
VVNQEQGATSEGGDKNGATNDQGERNLKDAHQVSA